MQAKFDYHLLPYVTLAGLNWICLLLFYWSQHQQTGSLRKVRLISSLLGIAAGLFVLSSMGKVAAEHNNIAEAIHHKTLPTLEQGSMPYLYKTVQTIDEYFSGAGVYGLMNNIKATSAIANYSHANWVSSLPAMWPLPAMAIADANPETLDSKRLQAIKAIRPLVMSRLRNEILNLKPTAIIVDSSNPPHRFPENFDFIRYFQSTPELKGLLDNYVATNIKLSLTVSPKWNYTVYVRNDYPRLEEVRRNNR